MKADSVALRLVGLAGRRRGGPVVRLHRLEVFRCNLWLLTDTDRAGRKHRRWVLPAGSYFWLRLVSGLVNHRHSTTGYADHGE